MTEMSRIERKKREQEKARADMSREAAAAVELETPDDEISSRQTYHKKKKHGKKKNNDRNPLFTSLAVMFVFIPIIVFVVFMYMLNQGGNSNPDQYDDVFYENKSSETGMTNENQNGEQEADQKAASQHTAAALQEEKLKESNQSENKVDEPSKKDEQKQKEKEQFKEEKKAEEQPVAAKKPAAPKQPAEQEKKTANAAQTPPVQQAPQPKKVLKHTVGEKETLFRISMKYYKNRSGEEKIRNYNQLSGNNVYAGQVLDIPIY
ncbi:LysM peptidoglycan-binding domain-containing protein [Bacillus haynesii]|uniref:LysM peptidoglycan-binding domain-containing protein n=1 Tax=Bacillus haynesii TaxID=1925021 RepID=UPI0020CEA135|nr:LysM peptidoglycan-binding domain-containing protein [Bacillus haynesii]MCY7816648.1 LysM peptidoglycan-binding domain-containing protein [Bacillus haynesii]MCY8239636.1 LysM peptidoglycan-binding domain-containing protein [Bacillus haynesii]MCY8372498.1 LysM peptidoglycan-binding domain-containing protein [Bacillus haynesii]MCY8568984.1 LysM peptidoglycan-binding domain-containing protein [Bacillus haynesii]MCY8662186.1 LysM peptidoglycan-binding domain-containing protein [Bacillus haynesi